MQVCQNRTDLGACFGSRESVAESLSRTDIVRAVPSRRSAVPYNARGDRRVTSEKREGNGVAAAAMRGILCMFAHPDDESFGVGGVLAGYAAQGVPVDLLCATRGQAGQLGDPPVTTREGLGAVRETALRAAGTLLGIREVIVLDYEDGTLRDVPYAPLLAIVMETYRRLRPTTVICFGPNGISGHPDHTVTHRAATEAFWRSRRAVPSLQRLYYPAIPPTFRRRGAPMGPIALGPENAPNTEVPVSPDAFAAHLAALDKHAETQQDAREMRAMLQRIKPTVGYFHRVEPPVAPGDLDHGLLP